MSQHDYQYAHANPVRFTDPTGYYTFGEVTATIALTSIAVSVWSSVGYVGYQYLMGKVSDEDIYGLYGDWAAGYFNGVSGGISTDVLSLVTGETFKPRDGFMWHMGQVAGISTMFLIGFKQPVNGSAVLGNASWVALWQTAARGYGIGKQIAGAPAIIAGLADDEWHWSEVLDILSLAMLGGSIYSVGTELATVRAANRVQATPDPSAGGNGSDEALRGATETKTGVSGGSCFVAGTEILTTEGEKSIEEIQVGDWVIADDPTTPGGIEARQVLETFVRHTDTLVDLYVDSEVISTTKEHPFWTPDKGWVEAKDLKVGSVLQTEDGRMVDVDKVEKRKGDFTVYNFKVEGWHTYYVSDLEILVHNANCERYDGPKPKYHVNDAHVPGPKFNPDKTPLPNDAKDVFKKAVPSSPIDPKSWFGLNEEGAVYRYSDANDGTAHFSGRSDSGDGSKNITKYALNRLGVKK